MTLYPLTIPHRDDGYLRRIFRSWAWCILLMPILLISCSSSEDSDLTKYIHLIKARPALPVEPIPEFKPLATFIYPETENRRSPFKPVVPQQQSDAFAPNVKRPKQPLEAFPLDALQFVGTLRQDHTEWALISQPGGMVTRVKIGDYMGQNYGQLISIKESAIEVQETIKIAGKWVRKKIKIELRTQGTKQRS